MSRGTSMWSQYILFYSLVQILIPSLTVGLHYDLTILSLEV